MDLEDLRVYKKGMEVAELIWKIVIPWNHFEKDTLGKQMVRSSDSIAANISEGFGRYHHKDSKKFYYYSRGSLFETKTWIAKANKRNLLDDDKHELLIEELNILGKMLNKFIKSVGTNMVNEDEPSYGKDE